MIAIILFVTQSVCMYVKERLCLFGFKKKLVWVWPLAAVTEMSLSEPTTTGWGGGV